MTLKQKLNESVEFLKSKGFESPEVGVVLGTGLGDLINRIDILHSVEYGDIPHFPLSTVEFHSGKLIFGKLKGKKVVVMQGRMHAYEGYSMEEIVFPVRVMKLLGIKHLLLSNAAGGINLNFKKGDLILIDDHINLQTGNPLIGVNDDTLGPRFPDMSCPYDKDLSRLLSDNAQANGTKLKTGVYVSVMGPMLETRAEYRYLKIIGADVVGMSTVPEVIAANHMGLPCATVSVVTDECDPDNLQPVDISEIIEVAGKADKKLSQIFADTIAKL